MCPDHFAKIQAEAGEDEGRVLFCFRLIFNDGIYYEIILL